MTVPKYSLRRRACFALAVVVGSGCVSYATHSDEAYADFQAGRFEPAIEGYAKQGSGFLPGAEAGMVALVAGDWDGALVQLGKAASAVEEYEEEALVSPESAARTVASFALNERMLEYHGEGY